ncbi:MAG: hypothetical protein J0H69_10980 [Burkholderiales bacterium]|nr:hypothetical protein [Burkholderiales bacterium]
MRAEAAVMRLCMGLARRVTATLLAAAALAACGVQDSPADAAHKRQLEGAWRYESRDAVGQPIEGTLRLGVTGVFSGTERVASNPEEQYSGEWFVTAGLFKLKTTRSGGERLGTAQTGFFTCALLAVEADAFACDHTLGGRTYRFVRLSA